MGRTGQIGSAKIAVLTVIYDTAHRIGSKLRLSPECVYLHAGTAEGARFLGIDTKEEFIPKVSLPIELQKLEPHEIEDLLCIYKEELRQLLRLGKLDQV
jgi:hypothetical protein